MAPATRSGASDKRLRSLLRDTFGLKRLRDGQHEVIDRVLQGLPTMAVMPTGAGKSLCYQLPALLMPGRTVVVSPLIALMKDQCDKLRELGVTAVQVNSAVDAGELDDADTAIRAGDASIVFVTPERLADPDFIDALNTQPTSLLVVDEAHCITQWGHDFRPAFLGIGSALKALGSPTVLALTATATPDVVTDVCRQLGIPKAGVFNNGTFRENLRFSVAHLAEEGGKLARALALVKETAGSGIVYTATVKACEELHSALLQDGTSVRRYHGRLPVAERKEAQDAYMSGEARVIVATNAFGLGIDKPDTRFVLHYQMPGSLDAYYQEAGRAGRDGDAADCTLLFLKGDRSVQQFFLAGKYPGAEDLDRMYRALHDAPNDAVGWTVPLLSEHLNLPRTKVQAVTALLKQQRMLSVDRDGVLKLLKPDLAADALTGLLATYVERRERDRATLERMVSYALTGQCRWRALMAHFDEPAPFDRCNHCDNCVRLAAAAAAVPVADVPALAPLPTAPARPLFAVGDAVKVRRYGTGVVTQGDSTSVTVSFAKGETRSFQPDFVTLARSRPVKRALTAAG